jgi:hypothetical protein
LLSPKLGFKYHLPQDLRAHADPNVVICIAGNKCDREPTFDLDQCATFADSVGAIFIRTSALTNAGVDELFNNLGIALAEKYRNSARRNNVHEEIMKLGLKEQPPRKASVCC